MIVVGAGPAGLAVAAGLRQRGVRPTVLEQSTAVGGSWTGRWDSLRLHTMRSLSGLPDLAIPRSYGRWVARDDFVSYLRDYADHFEIDAQLGIRVERVDRTAAGWRLSTSAGTYDSDRVVIATGYSRVPTIPPWPGRDSTRLPITHSVDYRNPDPFRGRRVLVVGSGNSATEIAAELVGAAEAVWISVRTPPNIVRRSTLGLPSQLIGVSLRRAPGWVMNPLSGLLRRVSVPDLTEHGLPAPHDGFTQFLRTRTVPVLDHGFVDHVRSGDISVVAAVDALATDEVELGDATRIRPDAVISATGFAPALESMVGHLGVLDAAGIPRVRGADTLPTAPGLHFVGITVELSGLLHEIAREARGVAQAVAEAEAAAA